MNNKNIIIHIGLHKTGTTYLQYNFFPRLEKVLYAHGNSFFVPWRDQVETDNCHMLLSYEGFSGTAWNMNGIKGIENDHTWIKSFETNVINLKRFFPTAVILVFFRKQGDLLLSMYKQYLHEGGTLPLKEFYNGGKIMSQADLSFTKRINILNKNFDKVYFLNYETFKKKGNDYLVDFFNIEFDIRTSQKNIASTQENKSISGAKLEILRKVNPVYNRVPLKLKKLIRIARLSPRDILQNRLSFWQPKDVEEHTAFKHKVNNHFRDDWEYFEKFQWKSVDE